MMCFFLNRVFQGEGLNVYNMNNIVKKHFIISIAKCKAEAGRNIV
jgi:hypothetical protein